MYVKEKLADLGYGTGYTKEPKLVSLGSIFSMSKLTGIDVSLGPEMESGSLGVRGENLEELYTKDFWQQEEYV